MKPKNIQSSAAYQRQRDPGDAPGIGRVKRMPGTGIPRVIRKRSRSAGRSDRTRDKRQIRQMQARRFAILLWLSFVLLATLAVLAGGFVWWRVSQDDRRSLENPFQLAIVEDQEQTAAASRLTDFPPPDQAESVNLAQAAVEADDPAAIAAHFHETDEADVETIAAFLEATPERDGTITAYDWLGPQDTDRLQMQSVLVSYRQEERMLNRLAHLVPDDEGRWRVDFPAFARLCDPPINAMDSPDGYPGGRVRIFIAPDTYYNGPFQDDTEWICYGMASPDCEQIGFIYARAGSPQQRAMESLLLSGERYNRATLEIRRVTGAEKRQFELARVLAEGWVTTPEPFDERF